MPHDAVYYPTPAGPKIGRPRRDRARNKAAKKARRRTR